MTQSIVAPWRMCGIDVARLRRELWPAAAGAVTITAAVRAGVPRDELPAFEHVYGAAMVRLLRRRGVLTRDWLGHAWLCCAMPGVQMPHSYGERPPATRRHWEWPPDAATGVDWDAVRADYALSL